MKKKLFFLTLFIILMLAAIPSAMAACYNHKEVQVSKKAATCTTAGRVEYRCYNCGGGHVDTIAKLGHSWGVWYDTDPATCQKKGTQKHNCRNCSATATRTVDYNRSNHQDYGAWETKRAACHPSGGYKERKCKCGNVQRENLAKGSHGWGVWYDTDPATCQKKGTQAHNCRNCGTTETRIVDYNRSNHQDYGAWETKRAACHPSGGYKERKCKCGNVQRENLAKGSHGWGVWYDTDPATCQKKGTQAHNCRNCGTTETRIVDYNRSNHQDYGAWETKRAACHKDGGYEERKCKCGQTERRNLDKKEHSYTWVTTRNYTCTTDGLMELKCSKCGNVSASKVTPAAHYSGQPTRIEQQNCEHGTIAYLHCLVCNKDYTEETGSGLGHQMSGWYTSADPTCQKEGILRNKCNRSGCTYKEPDRKIAKKEHSYEWIDTIKYTCTTDGLKELKCSKCGDVFDSKVTLAAHFSGAPTRIDSQNCEHGTIAYLHCLVCNQDYTEETGTGYGHKMSGWHTSVDPTCQKEGVKRNYCTNSGCDYEELPRRTIGKVDCVFSEYYEEPPEGCVDGKSWNQCKWCHTVADEEILEAPHNFETELSHIAMSCMVDGLDYYQCQDCPTKKIIKQYPAPMDHDWGDWKQIDGFDVHEKSLWKRQCNRSESESEDETDIEVRDPEHPNFDVQYEYYDNGGIKSKTIVCDQCGTNIIYYPYDDDIPYVTENEEDECHHVWDNSRARYENGRWIVPCKYFCGATNECAPTPDNVSAFVNHCKDDPYCQDVDAETITRIVGMDVNSNTSPITDEIENYIKEHPEQERLVQYIIQEYHRLNYNIDMQIPQDQIIPDGDPDMSCDVSDLGPESGISSPYEQASPFYPNQLP